MKLYILFILVLLINTTDVYSQEPKKQFGFGAMFMKGNNKNIQENKYSAKQIKQSWKDIEQSDNLFQYMDYQKHGDLKFVYAYLKILRNGNIIYSKESEFVDALIRLHKKGVKSIYLEEKYQTVIFPYILTQYTFQYDVDDFDSFIRIWGEELKTLSRTDWAHLQIQKILKEKDFQTNTTRTYLFWITSNPKIYNYSKKEFMKYYESIKYLPRDVWIMENFNNCMQQLQTSTTDNIFKEFCYFFDFFVSNKNYHQFGNPDNIIRLKENKLKIIKWYQSATMQERIQAVNYFILIWRK